MRAVELAKVAAAAEALRLRRLARRQAIRAGLGVGAAVFGIAVFVLLHIIIYDLLRFALSPVVSAIVVFALDLLAAGVLGMLALRSAPDQIEEEALAVRKQAMIEMRRSITVMAVAGEAARLVIRRRARVVTPSRRSPAWLVADLIARAANRRRI